MDLSETNENCEIHSDKEDCKLQNEIYGLRAQLQDFQKINQTLEETIDKNSQITKKLYEKEQENEELKKRLEILLKKNNENSEKGDNSFDKSIQIKLETTKNENSQLKSKNKELEEVKITLEEKLKIAEKSQISLQNELTQVYSAASTYFGLRISSLQTLLPNFIHQKQPRNVFDENEVYETLAKLQERVKKWRQCYYDEHDKLISIQAKQMNNKQDEQLINENIDLKHKNEQQASKINSLTDELDHVRAANSELTARIRIINMKEADDNESESIRNAEKMSALIASMNSMKTEKSKLKKKLVDALEVLSQVTNERNDLSFELKKCESITSDMKRCIRELNDENEELKLKVKNIEKKRIKQEKEIRKTQMDLNDSLKTTQAAKGNVVVLETDISKKQNTIDTLLKEKETCTEQIQTQKVTIDSLEMKLNLLNEQRTYFENEFMKLKKANDERDDQCEIIPANSWACSDFPRDLSDIVDNITRNSSYDSPTKIRNSYAAIARYYNKIIDLKDNEIKSAAAKNENLENKMKSFAEYLSRRFSDLKINFIDLLSTDQARESFGEYISNLYAECNSAVDSKQKLESQVNDIYSILEANNIVDAIGNANRLRSCVISLQRKYADNKKEIKKCKKIIEKHGADMQQLTEEYEARLKQLNNNLQDKNKEIERINNDLNTNKDASKKEVDSLKRKIQELSTELSECMESKQSLEAENGEMKSHISKMQNKIKAKKAEFIILQKEFVTSKAKYKELLNEQEADTEEKNQQMLQQMQKHTTESTAVISDLRNQIDILENKINQLNEENNELKLKIKQTETKIAASQTEKAKNQKLIESQYQASIRSIESEYKSKLNEAEQNKRQMISSISTILSPLLLGEIIDEYSLDSALHTIRSKFDLITMRDNRIRTILKIGPSQSIEEAISSKINN